MLRRRIPLWLLLCLILWLLGCGPSAGTPLPTRPPAVPPPADGQQAKVSHVVDGDTVALDDGRKVRYLQINTPERGRPFYKEATEANRRLVEGKTVILETDTVPVDQYGRLLAYVWVGDVFVNYEIVWQGYANVYTLPPNVKYEKEIRQAEREARESGRGLWSPSTAPLKIVGLHYDAPGNDRENLNGEWIDITNQGQDPINLKGYVLKDEGNNFYTFPDFTLQPGRRVRLFTGAGQDDDTQLFWNSTRPVWNNSGDEAFLRDPEGDLVDFYSY